MNDERIGSTLEMSHLFITGIISYSLVPPFVCFLGEPSSPFLILFYYEYLLFNIFFHKLIDQGIQRNIFISSVINIILDPAHSHDDNDDVTISNCFASFFIRGILIFCTTRQLCHQYAGFLVQE